MMASCWTWNVDPVIIDIAGPIQIRWYGLCFLGVFYFGYMLLRWQMVRAGRHPSNAERFVNWAVVGTLVGAWFGHRLFYEWDKVLASPLYLIDIRKGIAGLSSHGATVGLIVTIVLFSRRFRIPYGEFFDRFMWAAALSGVLVRLGNFFNSEVVGRPSDVPWAVCLPRYDVPHHLAATPRHPTQLYEFFIGLVIMGLLTLVDRVAGGEKRPRWLLTGTYFASYFGARFGVEFFKEQQGGVPDEWRVTTGALLSIPFCLLGVGLIVYSLVKRQPASEGRSTLDDAPVVTPGAGPRYTGRP